MRGKATRASRLAVLVLAVSVAAGGCNPVLGPSKTDANWRVYDSARFSLHVRPGSFAEQNAQALGEALDHQYEVTLAALGARFDRRVNGFLFNDAKDADLGSDYAGVGYPDTFSFRATCVPPLGPNLHGLLAHEANHVIIIGALGRAGTRMMTEGLASAVLSDRHTLGYAYYYAWTRMHRSEIPALERLADDDQWQGTAENVTYSASASFLAYLLETRGADRLRQLYYAKSSEFTARFAGVYGRPLSEVEAEWLAFCDRFVR
jgi:hypothetical protein